MTFLVHLKVKPPVWVKIDADRVVNSDNGAESVFMFYKDKEKSVGKVVAAFPVANVLYVVKEKE